ncbi:hypothetical protein EV424DRAFT_1534774 [Suillus variegatus]|nr:hypothetical protein EV424DRAFT_1534774 [Suillus variegatus]
MSYTTLNVNTHFSLFASPPASSNVFSVFAPTQSPRETHAMYAEFRQVLGASNGQKKQGKSVLKKIFAYYAIRDQALSLDVLRLFSSSEQLHQNAALFTIALSNHHIGEAQAQPL